MILLFHQNKVHGRAQVKQTTNIIHRILIISSWMVQELHSSPAYSMRTS